MEASSIFQFMNCYLTDSNYIHPLAKLEVPVIHILYLPFVISEGANSLNQTEEGANHLEINWSFQPYVKSI